MATRSSTAHPPNGSLNPIGRLDVPARLSRAWQTDRLLTVVGLTMLVVFGIALVGLVVDRQVITGAPAWLKPAKFAISLAIYAFTFLWLLTYVKNHPKIVRWAAIITAIATAAEMLIIAAQVVRDRASHFNLATPLDEFLWSRMRDFIIALFLMNLVVAILLIRQALPNPVFAWGLRIGLILSLVGMLIGSLMTFPNPATLAAFDAGFGGTHSIGVPDGGPGLPIVGWSTEGGDVRAPHALGLHALQLIPLLAWCLGRPRFNFLATGRRLALLWTISLGYLGLILILTWQALRGQSVIAPDTATLVALGTLGSVVVLAVAVIVMRARGQFSPSTLGA